jgi:CTP:molybdopterin cytidylyltransferase MocA
VSPTAYPIAAILLAAGDSARMGRPKPLLAWRGATLLERQIRLYQSHGCAVYVVLGRQAEQIAAACPAAAGAALLLNPAPERGMLSSLQIALAALPASTPAVFFTPVDNPGVARPTLAALTALWRGGAKLAIPRIHGRRGHPVLVDASLLPALRGLPASATPRDFVQSCSALAVYADLDDSAITLDIDTPADYDALLALEDQP